MKRKLFYIINNHNGKVIEVFRLQSERYDFLISLIDKLPLDGNSLVQISKTELTKKIEILLKQSLDKEPLDFGNRFPSEQCIEKRIFNGKEFNLETSGIDNLIIFALNIYENLNAEIIIKEITTENL